MSAPKVGIPAPPVAKRIPVATTLHGDTRVDDYAWLRNRDDPDVRAYLEAENAYTDGVMEPTAALQGSLYEEILGRIQETDLSVPYRKAGFWYYGRTEQGKQYPILCRKKGSLEAAEEVLLDMNALAVGHPFLAVDTFAVSDDGGLLAFSMDVTGFRDYTLRVKDLATGEILPWEVERCSGAAWAADGRTLFYVVDDAAKRPYRLHRHRLGSAGDDPLVYEESDQRFTVDVSRSRSRALLTLHVVSHTASEVRFLRAGDPEGSWRVIAPREAEHEYDVEHGGGLLWIRTNDRGRNFRLVTAPLDDPGRDRWAERIPHREAVMLAGHDLFARHLVLFEREGGLDRIRIDGLASGDTHRVEFPEPAYAVTPDVNAEFDSSTYRFRYQSFVTPPSVFDYHMDTRERTLLKETPVLGGYDRTRYAVERFEVCAPDGALVPVSCAYRRDVARDGSAPMHLTGYGSYGYPLPPVFSHSRISLLDRGVVCAIAHVRGGGEMGKAWHDRGRMLQKKNSFSDFVAVAESLVRDRYTSSDRLVIEGGSAGGLLVAAAINARPDLFRAVVSKVPFVDVLNTMLDPSLPLTVGEYEEWGDPRDPVTYAYIRGYCPYSNLREAAYPAMLVKTSFHDSQVMYWEPAKYVAKLRTLKTDDAAVLLKTNLAAGHGGASGRYDALRETAFDFAFVLMQLGIEA